MGALGVESRKRVLVVGAGSIGVRHRSVLSELGCDVRVVSRRPGVGDFSEIEKAIETWAADYVVVATETGRRADAIMPVLAAGFEGRLLIEKPLGDVPDDLFDAPCSSWVGYNLRFHPVVEELRSRVEEEKVLSIQARAGQYLPTWRPGREYVETASNDLGGGALRDLSHELDLLEWLVGPCRSVAARAGRLSDLGLRVEDVAAVLATYERAPIVTLELNYLDRVPQRSIAVTTNDHLFVADLVRGTLEVDGIDVGVDVGERNDTYAAMHSEILTGRGNRACTLAEGRQVMRVIEAIERAASSSAWVGVECAG